MFALIRLIRAVFGIVFYWQVITFVFGIILHLNDMTAYLSDEKFLLLSAIKIGILVISGGLAYYLGLIIHSRHTKKFGVPYPKLHSVWLL